MWTFLGVMAFAAILELVLIIRGARTPGSQKAR
jgi:hypothetical protein